MDLAARNAGEVLLSRGEPDDVAVIDAQGSHTYADLRQAVAVEAAQLLEWDLPPGSRVALLGPNSFSWVASYLAILHAGHTAVPFGPMLTPDDVVEKAAHVACGALLLDGRLTRRFAGVAEVFEHAASVRLRETSRSEPLRDLPDVQPPADDAVLVFTSGTTSRPRAVCVGHGNVLANTASIIEYLDLRRTDRMLVVLPFSYCYGASLLHTHLAVGASLRICETQAFPETIVQAIGDDGCTGFAGVPSSYQLLLRASSFETRRLPSLRHLQQAGGRLPNAQIQRVAAAQPQARMFVMYGQTEATARLAYLPPDMLGSKLGSVGRAVPGVHLRITDGAGADLPAGSVGEIRASGASITKGYWQDPDATSEKYVNGELLTGDLGRMDADGFLWVVDRLDDFIKSWGYRVSSHEVEDAALEHTEVTSAAAVGRPDPEAGEAVVLFVTLVHGSQLNGDRLKSHLRDRLAKHLVPQEIRVLDQMPLNQNGKVVKTDLRELAGFKLPEGAAASDEADLGGGTCVR